MAVENDTPPPTPEEIERFELTRPAQWNQTSLRGIGQIGMLVAPSMECDPNWLLDVVHDPRWATHYASLLEEYERRVEILAKLLKRRKPRFAESESHRVLFEPDEREPYLRELIDVGCTVPQQIHDALADASVMPLMPHVPAQPELQLPDTVMSAEITEAWRHVRGVKNVNTVFDELIRMAGETPPWGALIGYTSDGEIRYRGTTFTETGDADLFTKKMLRQRLHDAKKRAEDAAKSGKKRD